jgi:predicted DNA-binding transcriptional regulator YafY
VLIRPATLTAIRDGQVDLAYRRWDRPRVLVGTRMRTKVGLLEVTSLRPVDPRSITERDAQRAGTPLPELHRLLAARPDHPVYETGLRWAGEDPRIALRASAELTDDETAGLLTRLQRLDRASVTGPWTRTVLELIASRPAVRAPDLAESLGRETAPFKRDVRKLKELGLTESLEVGYRIAPRGAALLAAWPPDRPSTAPAPD